MTQAMSCYLCDLSLQVRECLKSICYPSHAVMAVLMKRDIFLSHCYIWPHLLGQKKSHQFHRLLELEILSSLDDVYLQGLLFFVFSLSLNHKGLLIFFFLRWLLQMSLFFYCELLVNILSPTVLIPKNFPAKENT